MIGDDTPTQPTEERTMIPRDDDAIPADEDNELVNDPDTENPYTGAPGEQEDGSL